MNNHIMIDLETFGTRSTSIITTLAAVQFNIDTGELHEEFSMNIDAKSCQDAGLTYDAETIMWWMKQEKETREKMLTDAKDLSGVLYTFSVFLGRIRHFIYGLEPDPKKTPLELWGNSARFDLAILENAYTTLNLKVPWNFREENCYRTMNKIIPVELPVEENGLRPHVALNDCKRQIAKLVRMYSKITL